MPKSLVFLKLKIHKMNYLLKQRIEKIVFFSMVAEFVVFYRRKIVKFSREINSIDTGMSNRRNV